MLCNLSFRTHNNYAERKNIQVNAVMKGTFTFNNWEDANKFFAADMTSFEEIGSINKIVCLEKSSDGLKVKVSIE